MLSAQQEVVDMPSVCFYFQVHQPYRLRRYTVFDLGQNSLYENDDLNCDTLLRVARASYLPMNDLLLKLFRRHGRRFKVGFSISGTALDQFEQYAPELIDSFKALADTGCVEFLGETYGHSLAFLYSRDEFARQVEQHATRIRELFGQTPRVFRNTELIYDNNLAKTVEDMGYTAILAEGADHVLGWRSPNFVYQPSNCLKLKLLLRNYGLSDDISFRFEDRQWSEWPLTADTFAGWCHSVNGAGETINLFMDYETFGEHHRADTGIFQFMEALPDAVLAHPDFVFRTPGEVSDACPPVAKIDVPQFMSWADAERDLTAWLGNDMQKDAIHALYALETQVAATDNAELRESWTRLQTSDHFYYMCTKWFADADVHKYFNPFGSPYDAYIAYMNVLADFELRVRAAAPAAVVSETGTAETVTDVTDAPQKKRAATSGTTRKSGAKTRKPAAVKTTDKTAPRAGTSEKTKHAAEAAQK